MAIVDAPPHPAAHTPRPRGRDGAIDLLRALCVVGVVLLHAIMVGVTVVDGAPVFANGSEGAWWIVPISWALQVMPLFFVIGGFAGFLSFRRSQGRGGTASAFVAARVHRLLRPAAFAVAIVGAGLAALHLSGVPAEIVAVAGFRYGQPLWFLGVFLLCQALLPALATAHAHRPRLTIGLLVASAAAVDGLRAQTGAEGWGFLNLAFVWLALQQLGFFLADGTIARLPVRARLMAGATALVVLIGAFSAGVYSPDLIANINPPTAALLLVGVVQVSAVSLFHVRIEVFSRQPVVSAFAAFVNRRTMTVYLWHMPVLLAMAGLSALVSLSTRLALPEPGSVAWWLSRPVWLTAALIFTALVAVALTRIETRSTPSPSDSRCGIAVAVVAGGGAVVLLLVAGVSVLTAAVAALGMVVALRLARRPHQPARRERVADVVRMA